MTQSYLQVTTSLDTDSNVFPNNFQSAKSVHMLHVWHPPIFNLTLAQSNKSTRHLGPSCGDDLPYKTLVVVMMLNREDSWGDDLALPAI